MKASELITRALRLINIPGRGASLAPEDQTAAFEALQEILDSESVSKVFVPGIRRHFFDLTPSKSIYSYGASSQADFRSDDFDDDPAPIKIEDAYIRAGSTITSNEEVDEYRFENLGTWSLGTAGELFNNSLLITATGACAQNLSLEAGKTYTIRLNVTVTTGAIVLRVRQDGADILNQTISEDGYYEYDFEFTGTTSLVDFVSYFATNDLQIHDCSIIERGKERLELPDGIGSDYYIQIVDQKRHNRKFSKGQGGRPYELLYSRAYPLSEIRLDHGSTAGDILVMDVLVNRVAVTKIDDQIRMHGDSIMWLRHKLAATLAPEYGKVVSPDHRDAMDQAWRRLTAGNRRINNLKVDKALGGRRRFDINRGDP